MIDGHRDELRAQPRAFRIAVDRDHQPRAGITAIRPLLGDTQLCGGGGESQWRRRRTVLVRLAEGTFHEQFTVGEIQARELRMRMDFEHLECFAGGNPDRRR